MVSVACMRWNDRDDPEYCAAACTDPLGKGGRGVITEVIVGVVAFATALIGLATAYVSRTRHIIHRHESPEVREPERSPADHTPDINLELVATEHSPPEKIEKSPATGNASGLLRAGTRDGLNSSILPGSTGASGGKGLPPRTHAIHVILFRSPAGLQLEEVEQQLLAWGYEMKTAGVTRNHLDHLCAGWGRDNVVAAVRDERGRYLLTAEGRRRLAAGPFSPNLP